MKFAGTHIQMACRQGPQAGEHLAVRSRPRTHVDTCQTPSHTSQQLGVVQWRDRDRALTEDARVRCEQLRHEQRRDGSRSDLQLDRLQRGRADLLSNRRREHKGPCSPELGGAELAHEWTTEIGQAWFSADEVDRPAALRTDDVRIGLQHRHGREHAGNTFDLVQQAGVEAVRAARRDLKAHLPDDSRGQLPHSAVQRCARNLRGEQKRHPNGDPKHREQLLHDPAAQAHTVEPNDVRQPHLRRSAYCATPTDTNARSG